MGNVTVEFKKRENCRQNNKVVFSSLARVYFPLLQLVFRAATHVVCFCVSREKRGHLNPDHETTPVITERKENTHEKKKKQLFHL
jgi:hypothetical protein